ncbi:MAG: VanZ family protein [Desulfonauticus sp.]|nr:VanZ family protein [Desulfonauticus sp.]
MLILSIVIVLYLSLYPFDFSGFVKKIEFKLPFLSKTHHSLSDIFSNIVLFMPLGFFWFSISPQRYLIKFATLMLFAIPFSCFIEFLQQFLPSRDPTTIDIFSNTLGAIIGLFTASLIKNIPKLRISFEEAFSCFLAFYLLCEPFIISLDVGDLKYKIKTISYSFNFNNIFLPSFFLAYAFRRQNILSLLFSLFFLESLRFFIVSIVIMPIKFLARLSISILIFPFLKKEKDKKEFILLAFSACYFLEALTPFKFIYPPKIDSTSLIPFKYFIDNVSFSAVFTLLKQLLCFSFWGLLNGPYSLALCLAFISELAQVFVQGRYPDTTTIFLAFLGVLFGRYLRKVSQLEDN